MTSIALHAAPAERRRGWFTRLRDRLEESRELRMAERGRLEWTEPDEVEPDPEPDMRMRSSAPPNGGGWPTLNPHRPPPEPHIQQAPQPPVQQPPTVHPPFSHQPATHTHVAIRMQRILVEASWDPSLTPSKLWGSMGPLVEELLSLVAQEKDQARRMARNAQAVQAQMVLLEDAALRGVPDEVVVQQAASGISGRAVHVADDQSTGTMPKITEDTPDPRTVAEPRDENPGDVEAPPEESPVHPPEDPMPLPTAEFVGGEAQGTDSMAVHLAPNTDTLPKRTPKPRSSPRAKRPPVAPVMQEEVAT